MNNIDIKQLVKETVSNVLLAEDFHHNNAEYKLYEASDKIIAIFEDNTRLSFDVHYRDNHGEDKAKWKKQAASKWKKFANEIHKDIELTECGDQKIKSWKECFQAALSHSELKEFIRNNHHQKVFPNSR